MEVHAHSHTARKKWTHYFWEFLMLFLAVFCGFLAEYQLEHKIEKDREKQYIQSLLEDLIEDTTSLAETINIYEENAERMDTFIKLLCSPDVKNKGSDLYYLGRRASRSDAISLHDRTFQMKNSGGFRLIRKQKTSQAIIEFYNRMNGVDMLVKVDFNIRDEYRNTAVHIFHPMLFNNIIASDNSVIRPGGNPALLTYDSDHLLTLAGIVAYLKSTRTGIVRACTDMNRAAKELIGLIKEEYHLN